MTPLETRLSDADDHWAEGRIRAARALYDQLEADSWHAAFQAVWIDAAFGSVDDERLAALERDDLHEDARSLLDIAIERVRDREDDEILDGTIDEWDIDALRGKPTAGDLLWWEQCGDRAIATGQWGLAEACFERAAEIMPEMYYDPPARTQGIASMIENHLNIVRSATEP